MLFFYSEFDGLEKLINLKDKIKNKEKLTLMDRYNLVFIPLMGNVDRVKVAFEVFEMANNRMLFNEDELVEIKKCQYIVAQIIAVPLSNILTAEEAVFITIITTRILPLPCA